MHGISIRQHFGPTGRYRSWKICARLHDPVDHGVLRSSALLSWVLHRMSWMPLLLRLLKSRVFWQYDLQIEGVHLE